MKEMLREEKDIIVDVPGATEKPVTPYDLLKLAKWILAILAALFFMGAMAEVIQPNSGVFEACKTILPPIATLVIGYYFGKSSN